MTMWAKFISSLLNISFTYTPRVNYYIYFFKNKKNANPYCNQIFIPMCR